MNQFRAVIIGAILLASCGSSSKGKPSSPSGGVPADMRDVERDGEGLVVTTFGSYPERKPDWTRASSVLDLLKQVWTRSQTANPNLPSVQARATDAAIANAAGAIQSQDQQTAAYAANAVGLAVPELFDYFHPSAPIGVVRMDAAFRQLGLDAHFGHLDGAKQDLASLQGDWAATKSAVLAKAPNCSRVGGTASVANDIDTSLSVIDNALTSGAAAAAEQETENGATEIDTLELLFDCPPGTAAPSTGLGAACTADMQCEPGQVCDTANAGGRCAPDPATAKVGTPCQSTVDCGSYERAACNTEAGDNYPGGYCSLEPCDDAQVCPPGGTCVAIGGETPACLRTCAQDGDCRTAEGYVCQLFVTTPPIGFGPSAHACAFNCTRDADCQSPLKCNVASGRCSP